MIRIMEYRINMPEQLYFCHAVDPDVKIRIRKETDTMKSMENLNITQEETEAVNGNKVISDEHLSAVNGGSQICSICPRCHRYVSIISSGNVYQCSECGNKWDVPSC